MPDIDFDDFCIRVDGEELSCTGDFQCESCGNLVDGDEPSEDTNLLGGATHARECPHCGEEYPLQPWTEE